MLRVLDGHIGVGSGAIHRKVTASFKMSTLRLCSTFCFGDRF